MIGLRSIFRPLSCWAFWAAALVLFATNPAPAQTYGLDVLQRIGKFLDSKLPATTPGSGGTAQPPALLSQVGAFSNLTSLTPRSGLIPFTVNSPLWTDGAAKQRWIAVPNDGVADTVGEKINFAETGFWQFPKGTVLVKQFDLPVDDRNPAIRRRMETRFMVHGDDGIYYGITYRWRADGTDADWGDSHKLRAYRFTLTYDASVSISVQAVAYSSGANNYSGSLLPGFSLMSEIQEKL